MYTIHKRFEPTINEVEDLKLEDLLSKLKYFARTFTLDDEKQIIENKDIDI